MMFVLCRSVESVWETHGLSAVITVQITGLSLTDLTHADQTWLCSHLNEWMFDSIEHGFISFFVSSEVFWLASSCVSGLRRWQFTIAGEAQRAISHLGGVERTQKAYIFLHCGGMWLPEVPSSLFFSFFLWNNRFPTKQTMVFIDSTFILYCSLMLQANYSLMGPKKRRLSVWMTIFNFKVTVLYFMLDIFCTVTSVLFSACWVQSKAGS